jgi:hypothetical protein
MIKNEEKIIERCLKNAISSCDAICVTDTGSTDSTCKKVTEIFNDIKIPGKLYHDEWKNFGYNRSNAFNNTVLYCQELGWDLNTTYGLLLDGDMILKSINFNKDELTENGYKIIQKNNTLEYYTYTIQNGTSGTTVNIDQSTPSNTTYRHFQKITQVVPTTVGIGSLNDIKYLPTAINSPVPYYDGAYVDFNKALDPTIKQIDFLSSVFKKFNLVIVADKTDPKTMIENSMA